MRIALIILLLTIKASTFDLNVTKQIPNGLIYNGEIYNVENYPYVVSVVVWYARYNSPQRTCAGSLIHELLVLTTANCVYKTDGFYYKVYQGSWIHNSLSRWVVKKFIHEDYDPDNNKDFISGDVGILKINKPFPTVKKYINIGGFPDDFAGGNVLDCIVIGFGLINEHTKGTEGFMNHVKVKYGEKACRGYYSYKIHMATIFVYDTRTQCDLSRRQRWSDDLQRPALWNMQFFIKF
ncbi:chymotrypsin-like elastase family member 2A isoform X2 [Acyrthosiphon pisum]|uniref:Peptidase S1 domain-containing protein n=1 Tax=Acyrthosiphon pisum TaxID=7029 RepID=A0A8R2FB16_ACYPI|nr:chymotrypsin-like elastase family member 2A isoform X2 [Acyrthosiphon pisum]|eukprot:XP_008186627.1 PREDICTED: mite allergen Der p 3-like isoform X2 [Acyrthosiphon pisum]